MTDTPERQPFKIIFADLECTGLDPDCHAIHELSFIFDIDGEEIDRLTLKMRPDPTHDICPDALDKCGVTYDQIMGYELSQDRGRVEAYKFLLRAKAENNQARLHFGEWNTDGFDSRFLRKFFGSTNFNGLFWTPSVNVMGLAGHHLRGARHELADFKLGTVARHLGIEVDDSRPHGAEYDATIARLIYKKLTESDL